jgi:ubiquinone/menaquinone biosynthesis C-methylase UbiE
MPTYKEICEMPFWKAVFEREHSYLARQLSGRSRILSVGCGPAMIERMLASDGFEVTGMDVSKEALDGAPDSIRKVVGNAEKMDFPDNSFDAVIYVASLQFIKNPEKALAETARVLVPGGKLVAMLLNTESQYFDEQTADPESYMRRIKHTDLGEMARLAEGHFNISAEYYLGITGEKIFESDDRRLASLYIISGLRR